MPINPDYRDLFKAFNDETVKYLVVGAHAVIFYAEPRYTRDLDVLVEPSFDNAKRVWRALEAFGAPLENVSRKDFTNPEMIYQIGIEPNRIDIVMGIAGVDFAAAWANKTVSTYGKVPINIIGKQDLIQAKRASNRPQDLLDIERLLQEE